MTMIYKKKVVKMQTFQITWSEQNKMFKPHDKSFETIQSGMGI